MMSSIDVYFSSSGSSGSSIVGSSSSTGVGREKKVSASIQLQTDINLSKNISLCYCMFM